MEFLRGSVLAFIFFNLIFISKSSAKDLTWAEIIQIAQQTSADLKSAEKNWKSALESQKSSQSFYYPTLSGTVGYSNSSDVSHQYLGSLNLNYNLFNGFQDSEKLKLSESNERQAYWGYLSVRATVSQELKSAYAGLYYADQNILLQKNIIKRREEHLRMVELRFQGGRENKGSLLLAQSNLKQAQYDELNAELSHQSSGLQLKQLLGLGLDEKIEISQAPAVSGFSEKINLKNLALNHPDYLKSIAQERAAHANYKVAQSAFYPTLNASGSVSKIGTDMSRLSDQWSTGLTLTVPLFSGLRDYYASSSQSLAFEASRENRESTFQSILNKLQQSLNNLKLAQLKLAVDESFVQAARVRADVARSKYNNGLLSFDEWNIIENDLITREKSYLQSKKELAVADSHWELTQGIGVFDEKK